MRKLVLRVFDYSLDGIIGEEDTPFFDFCRALPDDPGLETWHRECLAGAGLHIMGRRTYEGMAKFFPSADTSDHPYAAIMNAAPKAVLSNSLVSADWANTTVIRGDTAEQISKLRQENGGDILAHGGVSFLQSLVRLGLADEYNLTIFPYVAGNGAALFAQAPRAQPLELVRCAGFGNGMVGLIYRRPATDAG